MDGIAGQMADKDTRVQIITTNATPVSYTHLDVYKRQPLL